MSGTCAEFQPGWADQLTAVLPAGLGFAAGLIADGCESGYPEESQAIAMAVPKRRREFLAGRHYARHALAQLGCPPCAILFDGKRLPLWPDGYIGSITHSDRVCAAIVGQVDAFRTLGIDLEPDTPLDRELLHLICRPDEVVHDQTAVERGLDVPKLIFVAKEAAFKAYFLETRTFLEFHDVAITIDVASGVFVAQLANNDKPPIAGRRHFEGRFARFDGHFFAAVTMARDYSS
jgi:4'-phosphopantetheinyl transferase EntD